MTTEQIQHLLAFLGYHPGPADGVDGPRTRAAVTAFQKDFAGLTVDGQAGADTRKALRHAVAYGMPKKEVPESGTFWEEIEYFTREDDGICCPCGRCGGFPVEPTEKLMRLADKIRKHFGAPMIPSSTLRCQAHNDELPGSAPNSLHLEGRAMDFAIRDVPVSRVIAYTKQLQRAGEINYTYEMVGTGHVHMDVL